MVYYNVCNDLPLLRLGRGQGPDESSLQLRAAGGADRRPGVCVQRGRAGDLRPPAAGGAGAGRHPEAAAPCHRPAPGTQPPGHRGRGHHHHLQLLDRGVLQRVRVLYVIRHTHCMGFIVENWKCTHI